MHITANKNTVPNEKRSPFVTSGLRVGTPAVTTRGMDARDMDRIAECLALAIQNFDASRGAIEAAVRELCARHPLYE